METNQSQSEIYQKAFAEGRAEGQKQGVIESQVNQLTQSVNTILRQMEKFPELVQSALDRQTEALNDKFGGQIKALESRVDVTQAKVEETSKRALILWVMGTTVLGIIMVLSQLSSVWRNTASTPIQIQNPPAVVMPQQTPQQQQPNRPNSP